MTESMLLFKFHQILLLFILTTKKLSVLYSSQFVTQSINLPWQTSGILFGRVMAVSMQTVTWVMVSSTYHNLLRFHSPKGCFHMFSLEMTHLVRKTTWWNLTHPNIYLLWRDFLITGHHEHEESLKMPLRLR